MAAPSMGNGPADVNGQWAIMNYQFETFELIGYLCKTHHILIDIPHIKVIQGYTLTQSYLYAASMFEYTVKFCACQKKKDKRDIRKQREVK